MKMAASNGKRKMIFELFRRKRLHFRDMNSRWNPVWRLEHSTGTEFKLWVQVVSSVPWRPPPQKCTHFLGGRALKDCLEK
jgi:hypothetical protein